MFIKTSDKWFFIRTKSILKQVCNGSPTICRDYSKFCNMFELENFDNNNTQSFVGILNYKKNPNVFIVYKISKEENNVIVNEYDVLRQLDIVASRCPHFVRVYGLASYFSEVVIRPITKLQDPSPTSVERKVLLLEYIASTGSFYEILQYATLAEVIALVAQVLIAIRLMRALKITHNDLHTDNILIKKCAPNTSIRYVFRNKEIMVPTYGYCAVLIDFGLGRPDIEPNMPLLGDFNFTHYGFHADKFSPYVDYVRFLSNLKTCTGGKFSALNKWCSKLLKPIKGIDSNGWDNFTKGSVIEQFHLKISNIHRGVKLFESYSWIDNLQLLIQRPIQNMETYDISVFEAFIDNWRKFEERISSIDELNYLFKCLVTSVKLWRDDYLNQDPYALERIKQDFLKHYEGVVKFHCPSVNYEDMICSLILSASYLEGYYYSKIALMESKTPRRSGILAKESCDEDLWRNFISTFGKFLQPREDDEIHNCYLWDF